MVHALHPRVAFPALGLALLSALGACATAPGADAASDQMQIEGRVVAVDTDPWAYDGNAVVTVDAATGRVAVQLPARWNLCAAQPVDDVQALQPGDRVRAVGTSTAAGELVVCEQPEHLLRKLD